MPCTSDKVSECRNVAEKFSDKIPILSARLCEKYPSHSKLIDDNLSILLNPPEASVTSSAKEAEQHSPVRVSKPSSMNNASSIEKDVSVKKPTNAFGGQDASDVKSPTKSAFGSSNGGFTFGSGISNTKVVFGSTSDSVSNGVESSSSKDENFKFTSPKEVKFGFVNNKVSSSDTKIMNPASASPSCDGQSMVDLLCEKLTSIYKVVNAGACLSISIITSSLNCLTVTFVLLCIDEIILCLVLQIK